jgi:ankyrin repeat protein
MMDPLFQPVEAAIIAHDDAAVASILAANSGLATARSESSHPTILQCLVLTNPPLDTTESLIELLASQGAELTDPLIAAASANNPRALHKLLDLGAEIEGNGQWSPLQEALYWHNPDAVDLLLERGASISNLRTAAALKELEYIECCFDRSGALTELAGEIASPFRSMKPIEEAVRHAPEQLLTNALVYAAAWARSASVSLLLERGALINTIPAGFDYAGTALHYAAFYGHRAMLDQLLNAGADPSIVDAKIFVLPEDWAEHAKHQELGAYLRSIRTGSKRQD